MVTVSEMRPVEKAENLRAARMANASLARPGSATEQSWKKPKLPQWEPHFLGPGEWFGIVGKQSWSYVEMGLDGLGWCSPLPQSNRVRHRWVQVQVQAEVR